MKKSLGLMLAFSVASFVLLTGFHGGCGRNTPEARAKMINRMATAKADDFLDDLDATDVQRKRVHEIKDNLIKDGLTRTKLEAKHRHSRTVTPVNPAVKRFLWQRGGGCYNRVQIVG